MDRIRQQLADVQRQLAGLTPSQKMLALSLVAIMVITVVWSTKYASVGEQVKLLDQPLTAEQIGQIRNELSTSGVEYRVEGDAIYVPAVRRTELMAMLGYQRALPQDMTRHYDKAVGSIGSFDPHKKIDLTILTARQDALAAAIKRWPGIRDARVHVNEQYKRQVGGDILPSAAITLTTTGGSSDPDKLAEAATHLVAGAFAMLDPANIEAIVDGRLINSAADDSIVGGGSKLLELQATAEKHWERKLYNYFGYINGLRVGVSVEVRDDVRRTLVEEFDPETVVVPMETREETNAELASGGNDNWGEAGLVPNSGVSINGGGGGSSGESRDRRMTEERNRVEVGRTREERYSRGGVPKPASCTLSVPLSWVRAEWKGRNPGTGTSSSASGAAAEPTPEIFREFELSMRENIAKSARTLLADVTDANVTVVTYSDAALVGPNFGGATDPSLAGVGGAVAEAGAFDIAGLASEYGRPAAVIGLAAIALFFVSGIARRAPAPTSESLGTVDADGLAALTRRRAESLMGGGDDEIADALGADALLVGREIADEQLEAGQMVEQVQSLVKENPDAAAQLVKRWLSQG